jgi:hypothetical protein
MFDKVFKSAVSLALLMVGVAALLWSQNDRYRYFSDGSILFDSRTGDVFQPVDSPDGSTKEFIQANQKTGQFSVLKLHMDANLLKQYQHKAVLDQQKALDNCRSSMEKAITQRKLPSNSTFSGIEAVMPQPHGSCVSMLLKNPSGVFDADKVLVSNFCAGYLDPGQKNRDPEIEALCASLRQR